MEEPCTHLRAAKFRRVLERIGDPESWVCTGEVCGTTEEVCICLMCGNVGCGRFQRKHAVEHYETTGHPVVFSITQRYVFCYDCDAYFIGDDKNRIHRLREKLDELEFQTPARSTTRSGKLLRSESATPIPVPIVSRRAERMDDALLYWRKFAMLKAFNRWREFIDETRDSRSKDTTAMPPPPARVPPRTPRRTANIGGPGQVGLKNLGNTCFMNAVLQVLCHNARFRGYFQEKDSMGWQHFGADDATVRARPPGPAPFVRQATMDVFTDVTKKQKTVDPKKISLCHEIHNLFRVLWSTKWQTVVPHALLSAVWRFVPQFRGYKQQDAQEFLCYLLDRLHTELMRTSIPESPRRGVKRSREDSIITELFEGELRSEITCQGCGNVSARVEPFLDLSLDIPKKDVCTLHDCFTSFTSSENLEPKSYSCDKCGPVKQDAVKRLSISSAPEVLRIHLKRFKWSATERSKIDTHVSFPLDNLEIGAFMSDATMKSAYRLTGIIIHLGSGTNSGHYIAMCHNEMSGDWLVFNDVIVTDCSPEVLLASAAYILFYDRRPEQIGVPAKRQRR